MKLNQPLSGIGKLPGISVVQEFGNVWIASQDMILGGVQIKQGENVYKVAFGMNGHNGRDISAPLDTPVLAPHDGRLEFYGEGLKGYGLNARIYFDEEGFTWDMVFGHLHKYEGQPRQIKTGEIIGYVDNTGFSTFTHLHFGIRKLLNGTVMDYSNGYLGFFNPEPYLKKETFQVIYKKVGEATLYFSVGATLIPFATDYASYLKDFGDAVVVELPASEFAKFKISSLKVKI